MLTRKTAKKIAFTMAAAVGLSVSIPTVNSEAISVEDIFKRVHSMNKSVAQQTAKQGNYKVDQGYTSESAKGESTTGSNKGTQSPSKENSDSGTISEGNSASQNSSNNEEAINEQTNTQTDQEKQGVEQNSALADKIIVTGEKYMGTPYKFGASSNTTSVFDCSSFVQRVFKENGINLPRNSRQQSQVGQTVSLNELKKGDLLFYTTSRTAPAIGHVGIYDGNGRILHTYGPGGVRYDSIETKWLKNTFVTAKRVINQ